MNPAIARRARRSGRARWLVATLGLCALESAARGAACPNVQLVVDRSASMMSKWIFAKDALKRVVAEKDGVWPLGLSLFPSSGCDTEIAVRPAAGTQAAINAALDAKLPRGSTATATAIRATAQLTELQDATRGQYMVLITDGAPGCAQTDTADTAVQELNSARVRTPPVFTFVLGLMLYNAGHAATLTRMADAGGRASATAERFYRAESPFELDSALAAILARIEVENPGCARPGVADLGARADLRPGDGPQAGDGGAPPAGSDGGCACTAAGRAGGGSPLPAAPLALALLLRLRRARRRAG